MARLLIASLLASAGFALPQPAAPSRPTTLPAIQPEAPGVQIQPDAVAIIDVVFVLDTTGSMSGLIEGAKQKIWSIANSIATAKPRPVIRMGLVGYRDRGDEYITTIAPLTDDLDAVYSSLMGFSAGGGGDGPESVNQALHEAVTKFDWHDSDASLKLIYLVGDAPPHMDYEQDILYPAACEMAAKSGVIINTIQCGGDQATTPIWQEIARSAEGEYFQIDQSGGMVAVATPYDDELARLGAALGETVIPYGDREAQAAQHAKRAAAGRIEDAAAPSALAERAAYQAADAGGKTLAGEQELVTDVKEGRVNLAEIPADQLPPEMQKMTPGERAQHVARQSDERAKIQQRIIDLDKQRRDFMKDNLAPADKDSFDARVLEALRKQAAAKKIRFEEPR